MPPGEEGNNAPPPAAPPAAAAAGTPPAQGAAPAAPPALDMAAVVAQNQAMQQRMAQMEAYIVSRDQPRQAPQQEQPPGEEEYVDPAVQKLVARVQQMTQGQVRQVADQNDRLQFYTYVNQQGMASDVTQKAEQLHAQWMRQGVTVNGQPASRIDALHQVLGIEAAMGQQKSRDEARKAEEARRNMNASGGIESGHRAPRAPANLDGMTRQERLSKGYSHLDEEGF